MSVDQKRFEDLLARLSPNFRKKKLLEELEGIEDTEHPERTRVGYQDLFITNLLQAETQQALVNKRVGMTINAEMKGRLDADSAESEYNAASKWALVEAYAEEVARIKDALDEIEAADGVRARAGTSRNIKSV